LLPGPNTARLQCIISASHFQDDWSSAGSRPADLGPEKGKVMRLRFIPIWQPWRCWRGLWEHRHSPPLRRMPEKAKINHPHARSRSQSTRDLRGKRISFNRERFGNSCPNVSIVRDESEAEYVVLAANPTVAWVLLHYYITVYDKQGKLVFATDKNTAKVLPKQPADSSMLKVAPLLFS